MRLEKGKGCEGKVEWGWRVQSRTIVENCTDDISLFFLLA